MHIFDLLEQRQEIRKLFREQFLDRRSVLTTKLKMSASTSPFGNRISFGSIPAARDDGVEQILLVFAVHDRESARIAERAAVPAQHAVADGMKRPAPEPARVDREEIRDAIEHLARGFVGEGEEQDVARIDAVLEQVGDAISQGARLAASRRRR